LVQVNVSVDRNALLLLSKDDLIALVLAQAAQIEGLMAQVGDLEARLGAPPKTPDNSSTPPSRCQKPNHPGRPDKPRRGRSSVARALAADPDRILEATLDACPHCASRLSPADLPGIHAYDHIDLPPVHPTVTRIHRHHGACPCCHRRVTATAPDGFTSGSPFVPGLRTLIIHLHVTQAISFERLARLLAEVFGLTIPLDALASGSGGAIANILARAETPLLAAAAPIAAAVPASPVVRSDEISARVAGRTWRQWVLLSSTVICHIIAESPAVSVVTAFLDGAQPGVWVADRCLRLPISFKMYQRCG